MDSLALFAQGGIDVQAGALGAMMMVFYLVDLVLGIITLIGLWRVFEKAGEPGWAAIVPIYNVIVLLKITGFPIWCIIFYLIPCVNFIGFPVMHILTSIELAKRFNQGTGFAIGLIFLPFVFYPILGFGSARYLGGAEAKRRARRASPDYEDEEEPRPPRQPFAREGDEGSEEEAAPRRSPSPSAESKTNPSNIVRCPDCRSPLRVPPNLGTGKKVKCPKCNATFTPQP